jgi:hypothetical protein
MGGKTLLLITATSPAGISHRQQELSEVLGVSLATVNRDLARARDWLKGELKF